MTGFLLIAQIVLVVVLTIAVLLQKSSSIGLGAYSGSNESVFGAKGPGSFLAKTTFFLGFLFVANTIALGYYYGQDNTKSVVDSMIESTHVAAPSVPLTLDEVSSVPVTVEAPSVPVTVEAPSVPVAAEAPVTTKTPVSDTNNTH